MRTLSWRRIGRDSALVLTLVVGLPALAQAQLFPNLFIQRQRTPCAGEPPFYAHVRRDYYGYYPTCWRRFPEGWGCPCPNPEAPNPSEAFARLKRDALPPEPPLDDPDLIGPGRGATDPGAMPGDAPTTPPRRPSGDEIPPLPSGIRAPFETDRPGAAPARPGGDGARTPGQPGANPARPADPNPGRDPFDPTSPDLPRSTPGTATPPGPRSNLEVPALDRPKGVTRRSTSSSSETDLDPSVPVLALPTMTAPASSLPADPTPATTMPPSLTPNGVFVDAPVPVPVPSDPAVRPDPAQAPRRPSLLGGLFNSGSRRRR